MEFTPKPANDFEAFFERYHRECRRRHPKIEAVAAKWGFEDLIPGLSDFDTRFIVADGMTVADWCQMSVAVGQVHLDLCRRVPHWARNLEHLPGCNLMWSELTDPDTYSPEYAQWTFYRTAAPERLTEAEAYLSARPWGARDERYHLGKFCLYYGRYNRTIDPPVNLGPYESKYPLHSRFMHYFCPPLQSALCILLKRPVRLKTEAIRLAREMFPEEGVFREMAEAVERHYEVPELYEEPEVTYLEDRLERALDMLAQELALVLTAVPDVAKGSVPEWREALNSVPVSPVARIFDAARFSRLMKGRLQFYAAAPPHFDSTWPIENELLRLRQNFFETPFGAFFEVRDGEVPHDLAAAVPDLCPSLLTRDEVECVAALIRLLPGHWADGEQKRIAAAVAEVYDGFFSAQSKIAAAAREMAGECLWT